VGDVIGLTLDRMGTVGPELVVDGAWSTGAGVSRTGNTFTITASSATLAAQQSIIQAGKIYLVSGAVSDLTSGSLSLTLEGGIATTPTLSSSGQWSSVLAATATGNIFLYLRSTPCTAVVSGISVREITGNHASQSTTASKPAIALMANGRKAISFDPSAPGDFLSTGILTGTSGTIVCAYRINAYGAGWSMLFGNGGQFAAQVGVRFGFTDTGTIVIGGADGTGSYSNTGPIVPNNTSVVVSATWGGGNLRIRLNGGAWTTSAGTVSASTQTTTVGAANYAGTPGDFANAQIISIAYEDSVASDADIATTERYFAQRAGVTL